MKSAASYLSGFLLLAVAAGALYLGGQARHSGTGPSPTPRPTPATTPAPVPIPPPPPSCPDGRCPRFPRRLLLEVSDYPLGIAGGGTSPDGAEEVEIDLPTSQWVANQEGIDGLGLCSWASIDMAARWCSCSPLIGIIDRLRSLPGGAWPDRVDSILRSQAPGVAYRQYTGSDPTVLEAVLRSGRPVATTYTAEHMVLLVHCGPRWAAVIDNNLVSGGKISWWPREQYLRLWRADGHAWAVWLLPPGPPPVPRRPSVGAVLPRRRSGVRRSAIPQLPRCWGPSGDVPLDQARSELDLDRPGQQGGRGAVVVIAPAEQLGQLGDQVGQLVAQTGLDQAVVIHRYRPSDWQVQGVGYDSPPPPAVWVERSDGLVTGAWSGSPPRDSLVAALRRAAPAQPGSPSEPEPVDPVSLIHWAILGLCGVFLILKGRAKS